MKRGNRQTIFLATAICLTLLTLFVLRFEMTGYVVNNNWCDGYDVNRDGKVDSADLTELKNLETKYFPISSPFICADTPNPSDCSRADLNKDNLINYKDYNLLQSKVICITNQNCPDSICGDGTVAKTADGINNCMVDTTKCTAGPGPIDVRYGVINYIWDTEGYEQIKVCSVGEKNYEFIQPTNSCTKVNEIVPTTDGKCYSYNERTMCIPQGKVCSDVSNGGSCIYPDIQRCRDYDGYVVEITTTGKLTFYPDKCQNNLLIMGGCQAYPLSGEAEKIHYTIIETQTPKTDELCYANSKEIQVDNGNKIKIGEIKKTSSGPIATLQTLCGTSNEKTLTAKPTTNLCSGTNYMEGSVTANLIGWSWTCQSAGTGVTEICSATKTTTPTSQTICGTANGKTLTTAPSTTIELCTSPATKYGIVATTTSGWNWNCIDSAGKFTTCSAIKTTTPKTTTCTKNNGDLNSDNKVDDSDLNLLNAQWGRTCTSPTWCECADINQDKKVDSGDLTLLGSLLTDEETICCKMGAVVPNPVYEYKWKLNSECSNWRDGELIVGGSYEIVDNSYCTPKTSCGDGTIQSPNDLRIYEECESSNIGGNCQMWGYGGGVLQCVNCQINFDKCTQTTRVATPINYCNPLTNGQSLTTQPITNLCFGDNYVSVPVTANSTGWTWTCKSPAMPADSSTCSATKTTSPTLQSICGTANGKTLTTAPSTTIELCTSPATKYGIVATTTSGWNWNCIDSAGKFTTCSAIKTSAITSQTCTGIGYTCGRTNQIGNPKASCDLINRIWLENNTLDQTCSGKPNGCCGDCLYGFNNAAGDCYDLPQTCSKLKGTICASNQECSGENWFTASNSNRCCKTTCTTPTPSEIASRRGISKQIHKPSASELRTGYSPITPLKAGDKIEFSIGSTKHTLEIISLSTSAARIKISSNIIEDVISKGQTRKFELTGDHYYDLKIELKDITTSGAKIILTTINELKTSQEQTSQNTYKKKAITVYKDETGEDLKTGLPVLAYIVIGMVLLILFVGLLLFLAHKRKQRYEIQ